MSRERSTLTEEELDLFLRERAEGELIVRTLDRLLADPANRQRLGERFKEWIEDRAAISHLPVEHDERHYHARRAPWTESIMHADGSNVQQMIAPMDAVVVEIAKRVLGHRLVDAVSAELRAHLERGAPSGSWVPAAPIRRFTRRRRRA